MRAPQQDTRAYRSRAGRRAGLLGALALCTSLALASTDPALEARSLKLSEQLRCLVCQNQSIAESNADLAMDLKRQVREMLAQGHSDDEIRQYMVERYGDFVLYKPPFKASTLLLWGGPAALLLLALGGFAWTVHLRRQRPAPPIDATAQAHARALLQDPETDRS